MRRAVRRADLPGADPAGGRPVAPVPVHLRAVDQPGRAGPQPRDRRPAVRPGQGADACCPGSSSSPRAASSPLEDVIARHLDQLFSGMQVVQHHTFRVTRNEDVEVEEDDAENLLLALEKELLRRKVGRPPVRLEVEDDIDPKMLELLISELDITEKEVFHAARAAGPARAVLAGRPRPGRAEVPGLPALHPPAPGRGGDRQAGRHVRRPQAARRAAAPPVRLVRHQRAALHRAGGRRPAGAGDQADPLPHLGRLPDHRRPDRGGRGGQAGAGAGRDQGPVRRAGQHRLGPAAGAARLPRGLRPARAEDPLQAVHGGPRRAGRAAPLRPHRHRQLQPEDGPACTRTWAC